MKVGNKKPIIMLCALGAVLLVAVISVVLVLRGNSVETIAEAENDIEVTYSSFCTYEHDDYMNIDGKLDEDAWTGKKWFKNTYLTNVNGTMPTLEFTGFATEYGVYLASKVNDTNLVNDGQRSSGYNSCWELNVTADNVGEERENDALYKTQYYIDMRATCSSNNMNIDRAVAVKGKLNSGETEGAVLEAFIPWEELQIDTSKGVPTDFRVLPVYKAVLLGDDKVSTILPVVYNRTQTKDYYRFGATGYLTADAENAIVGDSKFGNAKTGNWDVSKEPEGEVSSPYGEEHHKIFFSQEYGENLIVESTIVPVGGLNNDYPKAGIYFQNNDTIYDTKYHSVFLNMQAANIVNGPNGTKNFAKYQLVTLNNEDNKWNQKALLDTYGVSNTNPSGEEGVKLTVIKYGEKLMYFADDKFLYEEVQEIVSGKVIPGFYSLGANAVYKNYSCDEIDLQGVKSQLEEVGRYFVDVKTTSKQGTAVASNISVEKNGEYDITLTSQSGYQVSSILINGQEKIQDARKNAKYGVYTVKNVKGHQEVKVSFEKCKNPIDFTGKVTDGKNPLSGTVVLASTSDGTLRYEVSSSGAKGYRVKLPAGKYRVVVSAENYATHVENVTINKEMSKDFVLKLSDFPRTVQVNGKTVQSNVDLWDLEKEENKILSTSFAKGAKHKPLYFSKTATDFVVTITANYTTNFVKGESEYQPDLMAGFVFNDGTSGEQNWIMARNTGVVYTGWKAVEGLSEDQFLRYPTKRPVTFTLAKSGKDAYIYLNGSYVYKMDWAKIAPLVNANKEMAIGITMIADKTADIEISNYSLLTGKAATDKYIRDHAVKTTPFPENPMFAKTVLLGDIPVNSKLTKWDLSELSSGILKASFAMGSKQKPIYFTKTGSDFSVKLKGEYTTTDFKNGVTYQDALGAGFEFTDGTNKSWIISFGTGYVIPPWTYVNGINVPVMMKDTKIPVEFEFIKKGEQVFILLNGRVAKVTDWATIAPNINSKSELAIGVIMLADNEADIKISNCDIKVGNEVTVPDVKIDDDTNSVFGKEVTVNGKIVSSSRDIWDMSKDESDGVVSIAFQGGLGKQKPIYFKQTGKDFVAKFTATNVTEGKTTPTTAFAGLQLTDGTNYEFVGAYGTGYVYTDAWTYKGGLVSGQNSPWVLHTGDKEPLDVTFVKSGDKFYIYMNGNLVDTANWSAIAPSISASSNLAVGLIAIVDEEVEIEFKNYDIKFGTDAVNDFLNNSSGSEDDDTGSEFAKELKVNGKDVFSNREEWDLTKEDQKKVSVSYQGGTGKQKPIYFKKTGKDFVAKFTATNTTTGKTTPATLFAGLQFTDGTNYNYVGAYGTGYMHTNWTYKSGLVSGNNSPWVLHTGDNEPLDVILVKSGDTLYIYMNDNLVDTADWATVAPDIAADSEMAVGLIMIVDEEASVEFKNYSVEFGTDAVNDFLYAEFPKELTVNNQTVISQRNDWDLSKSSEKVISTTAQNKTIFFGEKGTDFVAEFTAKNTTPATPGSQRNLMAGFQFTDGTHYNWIGAYGTGYKYTGNVYEGSLIGNLGFQATWVLNNNIQEDVKFTVVKDGDQLYVFMQDKLISQKPWATIAPEIASDSEMAIGIFMGAEPEERSLEIKDYSVKFGEAAVNDYLYSEFPSELTVNGQKVTSQRDKWDLSKVDQKLITTTAQSKAIYFKETGKDFVAEFTATNKTTDTGAEQNIMAGFEFTDGTNYNWVGAFGTGYKYTGDVYEGSLISGLGLQSTWVLNKTTQEPLKFTVVKQGAVFYVYMNNQLIKTTQWATVAPNITNGTEMAVGMFLGSANGTLNLEIKDYSVKFGETAVNEFLSPDFPLEVTVNGQKVTSNRDKWDLSKLSEKVISTTAQSKSIYFKDTGKDFVAEFTAKNTTATTASGDANIMAGFEFSDGTHYNWIGAFGTGYKYTGGNDYVSGLLTGLGFQSTWVLNKNVKEDLKFTVVKKGDQLYVYMQEKLVSQKPWATIAPEIDANSDMAVGIFLGTANGTLSLEVKNYSLKVGTTAAETYINSHQ